jgi:MoxR-like ATPase
LIFSKLGIHGFSAAQERAIFAGMLSGEPVLLVGPPGVAKTELVKSIGAALREDSKRIHKDQPEKWFDYQIYDASKLNFEDLVGYPSLKALQADTPTVKYIPTPSSIWNKELLCFDELNRCAEDRQSNLFEIIRSRKLHGIPTNNMFIFSTMNPYGDSGTLEMSDALVDRHTYYLRLDKFEDMTSAERRKVIKRVGDVDGVGFGYWGTNMSKFHTSDDTINEKLADIGAEIRETLVKATDHYNELKKSLEMPVVQIIDKLIAAFKDGFKKEDESVRKECTLSGRRSASVYRAILASRAVEVATLVEGKELTPFVDSMINTCRLCMPIGIGGALKQDIVDKANQIVDSNVRSLWPTIKRGKSTVDSDKIAEALSTTNPIRLLDVVTSIDMNEETRKALFSKLIDKDGYKNANGDVDEHNFRSVQALLFKLNKEMPGFLPAHIKPEVTAAQIEEVSQEQAVDIPPKYVGLIQSLADEHKGDDVLYFALKCAFGYHCNNIETDDDAVRAVLSTQSLCDSVKAAIEYHKEQQSTTTKTNGTNGTDSKKDIAEKIY